MDEAEKGESDVTNPRFNLKIITDPSTGLPVLDAGPNAPTLTSTEVEEILIDFS